ncbi:MAG: N-acetylmuramoyl-L-alanine amidase [Planctomycetota bacterium]
MSARALTTLVLCLAAACRAAPPIPTHRFPAGHELVVAGERVPIDAPVVLWTMEPFYDAYREAPRFAAEGKQEKRYRPGREPRTPELAALVAQDGWTRSNLAEQVDLFVLHYDACGTSQTCFRVLQDERILSVHFLLDVDGTLYQTLDLAETAWHARAANPRSIGVEIAHVGAFPPGERERFERWYEWSETGTRIRPARLDSAMIRTLGFEGRPAREDFVRGSIHGEELVQPDFTPEQYRSLAALARALHSAFPRIALDAPRDSAGHVRMDALTDAEEAEFSGILGHHHLQTDKLDPGPAFDWERFLAELAPQP